MVSIWQVRINYRWDVELRTKSDTSSDNKGFTSEDWRWSSTSALNDFGVQQNKQVHSTSETSVRKKTDLMAGFIDRAEGQLNSNNDVTNSISRVMCYENYILIKCLPVLLIAFVTIKYYTATHCSLFPFGSDNCRALWYGVNPITMGQCLERLELNQYEFRASSRGHTFSRISEFFDYSRSVPMEQNPFMICIRGSSPYGIRVFSRLSELFNDI